MGLWDMIRQAASGDPPDHWDRTMESLRDSGFPDSRMRLDTGHRLFVYHNWWGGNNPFSNSHREGVHVQVWHPALGSDRVIEGYLGDVPEHVGPHLRRMFAHPDVMQAMRGQMTGRPGLGSHFVDMTQGR